MKESQVRTIIKVPDCIRENVSTITRASFAPYERAAKTYSRFYNGRIEHELFIESIR